MRKLDEVSSKRLVLVDSFEARKTHILTIAFSMLVGVTYSAFLWFVCSTRPGVISALLLFGSQIAIGFPATRAYYDLGVSNRENLHLLDPAKFNSNSISHDVELHIGEIPLLFEKIDLQISKYDVGSLDDLSDIAWFGIFVWAAFSSTSFFFGIGSFPICLAGTLILLLACLGNYLSGYWTQRNFEFEDDLSHLQYYVEKRLRNIDAHLSKNNARIYVQIFERWRTMSIKDFNVQIKPRADTIVEYHMGFSSSEQERIVVKTESEKIARMYDGLANSQVVIDNGWHTQQKKTPSDSIIEVINRASVFSVNKRSSFVTSPSVIDESSSVTAEVFTKVISLVSEGDLS